MQTGARLQVHRDEDKPPFDPGELDRQEATTVNSERMHQPRVCLPGRGDHKPARRQSALVCWNQCRISCLHLVMLAIARVSDLGCPGA